MVVAHLTVKCAQLTIFRTSSWGSADKPLPSAPKATKVQTFLGYCRVTLRSLGLNVLVYALQHFLGYGLDEIPKKAFHRDRIMALFRAMIHLLPLSIAMAEVIINWRGYYIGADVQGLSYFQFIAKLHEMAMQSSLAVIVFCYMREELFSGSDLPIGAILSGLQLTQVSYLWSMELWGIALSSIPIRRKFCIMLVIIIAVLLASTVGPSSAILLIPNLSYWPAGNTHIWLNITANDLWPTRLDGTSVLSSCSQAPNVSNPCPSSEWESIHEYLSLANGILPPTLQGPYSITPYSVQLTGQGSLRQLIIQHHQYDDMSKPYDQEAAQATAQHGAVADALSGTSWLWSIALQNSNSRFFSQQDALQTITEGYYQPYTLVSCGQDVIQGDADDRPVAFPIPPGSSLEMLKGANVTDSMLQMLAIVYPGITRSDILDTAGPKSEYRVKWVDLPEDPFNGTSIGAVILQPTTNSSQEILLCNLAAGWGSSSMNMSSSPAASGSQIASSSIYDPHSLLPQASDYEKRIADSVLTFDYPIFPQRRINISESWAEFLNPTLPTENTTVVNALMGSKLVNEDDAVSANIIMAGLLANGLSRTGFSSRLQGNIRTAFNPTLNASIPDGNYWFGGKGDMFQVDPKASQDWVKLRVSSSVKGYAFSTEGFAPKVTIVILLIYCSLVAIHILYAAMTGVSSTSWDSIAEFVVLAVNSSPTVHLRNTCAGITQMSAFRLPVRILTSKDPLQDQDHLELVFGGGEDPVPQQCRIEENKEYGTMLRSYGSNSVTHDNGGVDESARSCRPRPVRTFDEN